MPYIDKEKFRMHIIRIQRNPLKVILTDEEKEKFIQMLDEVPTAYVVEKERYDRLLENATIMSSALSTYQNADMVEVVRCKDCKYYLNSIGVCGIIDTRLHFYETDKRWPDDFFCAWGERKETEDE